MATKWWPVSMDLSMSRKPTNLLRTDARAAQTICRENAKKRKHPFKAVNSVLGTSSLACLACVSARCKNLKPLRTFLCRVGGSGGKSRLNS